VARSYVTLAEHPGDTVRLASAKCDRWSEGGLALGPQAAGPGIILSGFRMSVHRQSF